ncbi:putative hydrolase YtaP [Luteitalea sp. TBR-22]|uniref:dienelactone hydrolase family protein n=1 Tax=Luteitalea sp. TBR-22 TaxID=2802971 RepID=UPI001AF95391|nr:alpha/beta hydrolase family protein [Luteitalea sp. TBR-22]BCS31659.1 putative hydrolase YtaP [Luteitalea sp. TBR-22]
MSESPLTRREVLGSLGSLGVLASTGLGSPMQPASPRAADAASRRAELYALLGRLPDRKRPVSGEKLKEEERDGYVLETWRYDLNGLEPVPGYVARPKGLTGKAPGVVFCHSHGGGYKIGKQEFIEGRSYLQPTPYAKALTDLGYVAICIDTWIFGERSHTSELDMFKAMLLKGQVLWGMMVYDSLRAVDVFVQRPDVDASRLATLGMSMGSTAAWYLAALDERMKVCVDINCLTDLDALIEDKGLSRHGIYYYVPDLMNHFTTAQINALIAPRAHLALAGLRDKLTPVAGLDRIDAHLKQVYASMGVPERWQMNRYDVEHQETPEGRQAVLAFLRRFL